MSAIKRIIDKTWYGAEPRKAICDAAAGEYLALKEAESQRDTLRAELAQVCAENEGHKIIEAQLQFVVDEARKIIQAFSNHDDYIGRKTVMQAAEDWITAHTDDHTDSDEDLEIFSILK